MRSRFPFRPIVSLLLPLFLALSCGAVHAATYAATVAEQCVADVDDARAFIAANDAGASASLADHGPAIAAAYDSAHAAAAQATDAQACLKLLNTYVHAWRAGHLGVMPAAKDAGIAGSTAHPAAHADGDPRAPRLALLSKDTLVLTLPTFDDRYGAVVRDFVAAHRAALASHRNWIVDVRNNDGGSDDTYAPLMGWLMDGPVFANTVEYFVTPANIAAQEAICAQTSNPADCDRQMKPVIAAMRAAAPGSFVMQGTQRVMYSPITLEPTRPARVAVLIDHACGSSCEQFVLEARTSFRVKLIGRPTFGVLDVSNLRPHPLPSGARVLYYATTRSTRLPDMRIDGIGIAPDILLEKPADEAGRAAEVTRVQRWLEGGSLAPEHP